MAGAACTLVVITATGLLSVPDLSLTDATTRFWELNEHAVHPDVATEAIYCDKKLVLILNQAHTDVMKDAKPVQTGEQLK